MRALALLLFCLPLPAWGLASDRDQPIEVEADRATLNQKEGMSIYEGNVKLTQGTLRLQAATMTVYNSSEQVDRIILIGNPATFVQRPEGRELDLHAEAARMEYHAADERIILLGAARVWQTDGKELRSEKIIYNLRDNTASAGNTASGDRVRITLQPRSRQQKSGEEAGP
jgi:lipopolysaccharide export system protein LptA